MKDSQRKAMFAKLGNRGLTKDDLGLIDRQIKRDFKITERKNKKSFNHPDYSKREKELDEQDREAKENDPYYIDPEWQKELDDDLEATEKSQQAFKEYFSKNQIKPQSMKEINDNLKKELR